jgi:hypothetical protein
MTPMDSASAHTGIRAPFSKRDGADQRISVRSRGNRKDGAGGLRDIVACKWDGSRHLVGLCLRLLFSQDRITYFLKQLIIPYLYFVVDLLCLILLMYLFYHRKWEDLVMVL